MPAAATQVKWMTRAEACVELGLKPRRLRDYIAADKIRSGEDGLVHAGDIARLASERRGRKAISRLQAVSNVPGLGAEDRELLRMTAKTALGGQALARLQPAVLEARPFDAMPDSVYLSVKEAAAYKRVSGSWIAREAKRGLKHILMPNRSIRIRKSELDKL